MESLAQMNLGIHMDVHCRIQVHRSTDSYRGVHFCTLLDLLSSHNALNFPGQIQFLFSEPVFIFLKLLSRGKMIFHYHIID